MTDDGPLMPTMVSVVGALEALSAYSDPLIWLSVAFFLAGAVLEVAERRSLAVPVAAAGWVLFGVFWLSMFHYFYIEFGSPLEGVLSLAALPLSLYTAYLLVTGRDSLLVVSRAIACMGLIYLPVTMIPAVRTALIESVAAQSAWVMELFGYDVSLVEAANGYQSRFAYAGTPPDSYSTYIIMACTGIGSIAIFGGLAAAVRAPLRRKVAAFAVATGIIHVLNIGRNAFVALAAAFGWFDGSTATWLATTLGGNVNPSFFVAHHVISQSLSVVALVGITLVVVRILPEVIEPLEEVLFVLTNTEYDLAAAIGQPGATGAGVGAAAEPGDVADLDDDFAPDGGPAAVDPEATESDTDGAAGTRGAADPGDAADTGGAVGTGGATDPGDAADTGGEAGTGGATDTGDVADTDDVDGDA